MKANGQYVAIQEHIDRRMPAVPGHRMKRSVVVPVYGNEATLPDLLKQLADLHHQWQGSFAVVFVVDGSPDNSFAYLKKHLPDMPFPSQLVNLSRNFGAFAAVRAGLTLAAGDVVAVLAADLQQPVSSVSQFFDALDNGADIAVGHPPLSRMASNLFWRLYRYFVQPEIPPGGIDSFGCTRQVRDILVSLPEANSTLVGLLFWVGFRREVVTYQRAARRSGKSGWSLARKLRYAFDTAFAFSDLPITVMIATGAVGLGGAVATTVAVAIAWVMGSIEIGGYTLLMLAVLFSFSTTILALGIVGGYVWRIFENTKGRPMHLIRTIEQITPAVHTQAAGD